MVVSRSRTYHFVITFEVDEDHLAFDDPEWAADAACGCGASRMSTGFGRPIRSPGRSAATSCSDVGHPVRPGEDFLSRSGEQRLNGRLRKAARRTCPCPKRAVEPALQDTCVGRYPR